MMENEISLIADKLGMTITQIYSMNLQYQEYVVQRNFYSINIALLTMVMITIIGLYLIFRGHKNGFETEAVLAAIMTVIIGIVISFIVWLFVIGYFDTIILPSQFPEYCAMRDTMYQLKGIIP